MKTKLFVMERVPGVTTIFLVGYKDGALMVGNTLFTNKLPADFKPTAYEFVDTLDAADYALYPHAIKSKEDPIIPHVVGARTIAQKQGKKLIVTIGGDLSHNIFMDDVVVIKGSQYKRLKRPNEIIAAPTAEDFAETLSIIPRTKSVRPLVSFCGWAGFSSPLARLKYLIRNAQVDLSVLTSGEPRVFAYKKGIYWRRKTMKALRDDSRIDTRFIVRSSFSANSKTISLDPKTAREEYVRNMYDSDFVLCPKGDGNFSVRFYEAISMGRIPILIDTDVVLPLEGIVEYDSFILRVPYQKCEQLADIVADFYTALTEEQFRKMQEAARAAYIQYLRYDAFLNTVFTKLLPPTHPSSGEGETTEE